MWRTVHTRIFSGALLIRLAWWIAVWLTSALFTGPDSSTYLLLADNLLNEGAFSLMPFEPYIPDMIRTPGYPVFLIPFRMTAAPFAVIALSQMVLGALVPLLVYDSAKRLGAASPLLGAGITMVDFCLLLFTPMILSDGLFVFLLTLCIWMFIRGREHQSWWWGASIVLGLAILVRPIGLYLPLLFFLWTVAESRQWKRSVLIMLIGLIPVFGWKVRNEMTFDTAALSTMDMNNLLLFNAAAVEAEASAKPFEHVQSAYIDRARTAMDGQPQPSAGAYRNWARQQAFEVLAEHPVIFAKQSSEKMALYFFKPPRSWFARALELDYSYAPLSGAEAETGRIRRFFAENHSLTILLSGFQFILSVVTFILAVIGLQKLWQRQRTVALLLFGLLLYFLLTSTITMPDARFRMPVVPVLGVLAAMGVGNAGRWTRDVGGKT